VIADDAAINASALVIVRMRVLVAGQLLISKYRMVPPWLQQHQARVDPGSALFRLPEAVQNIATAETNKTTVASQRLDNSIPSPTGSVATVSVPIKPIHNKWMTAAMISGMNKRSSRVVGMRRIQRSCPPSRFEQGTFERDTMGGYLVVNGGNFQWR
jgi:hypothetical protein